MKNIRLSEAGHHRVVIFGKAKKASTSKFFHRDLR